ncbi:hypothetical protein DL770_007736 [Monosporascus sp. CRB-9-2]|nr:hypothetical protein DL770_007736 [Monosporascus sp. CRB-9-2]
MRRQLTRDITGSPRSRQNNNPLADLGKVNGYLVHRKRIAIDRLMALLDTWLDNNPAFARHTQEGPASSSRCAASDTGDTCSTGTGPGHSSSRPKRGLPGNGMDGSDPSDDGDGKKERGNKRSRVDSPRAPPFACPFFKNDSSKHKHKQACTGPAQHQLLKKKPSAGKASTKQWIEIYQIIFPKAKEIPSPYYEYEEGRSSREWDTTQAYREVLRDEVTQRVREALETRYDQIEDSLKADFVDIVRNAFRDALKQHPDPRRSAHRGSAETQEVGSSTSGASQASAVAGAGTSPSEDLLSYIDFDDFQPLPATDIDDASLLGYTEQLPPNCELEPYLFPADNLVDSGTGLWRAQRGVPGAARSRCRGL